MRPRRSPIAALVAIAVAACGPKIASDHPGTDLVRHLPATLEAPRPKDGEPRALKVRIYADAATRARPHWREDLSDQLDYANQLLTPLLGVSLEIESVREWDRGGQPEAALPVLVEHDQGDGVAWVIGYVMAGDTATKVMADLGIAEPLGRHVVVRGWAEKAETDALAATLPDLREAERAEVLAAHRRHKQTVVLLRALAATLGAIDETDPGWIQHPSYSSKMAGFSDRNRELLQLAIDEWVGGAKPEAIAPKLLAAIEKAEFGGWVPTSRDEVTRRLRNVIDASKHGKVAAAVPTAAYDQYARIRELARQGRTADALAELDNLLLAYPGNAAMHQLRCEILLATSPKGSVAPAAREACGKAAALAPGDPAPHLAVAEALARAGDVAGARAELVLAAQRVSNLPTGAAQAWKKIVAMYSAMGALTWTEEAIAAGKLGGDPIAHDVAQTRARYGVPRGAKFVTPDQEAALIAAIKEARDQINKAQFAQAARTIAAGLRKWPGASGFEAMRCDLEVRRGRLGAARAACARALAVSPGPSWALYLSGVLAINGGATAKGIAQLKQAITVDPDLGQAWRTLAKAYRERTKDRAALDQLARDYQARFGQPLPP